MALLKIASCNKRSADYLLVSQSTTLISSIYLYFPVYDFIIRYRTLFYLYSSKVRSCTTTHNREVYITLPGCR